MKLQFPETRIDQANDPQRFIDSLDPSSFSYHDIQGRDSWKIWTPTFTTLTVVGTLVSLGRYHTIGRHLFFSVAIAGTTSIASTAGNTYMNWPIPLAGALVGSGSMVNVTTGVAVGICVVDAVGCLLPTQLASGNTFGIAGWYEI